MDKKSKKQTAVLRERLQKLQAKLAGAKRQQDDPGEIQDLERQIAKTQQDLAAVEKE